MNLDVLIPFAIIIIALLLIYAKLAKLGKTLEDKFSFSIAKWDQFLPHHLGEISRHLEAIKKRTTELCDILAIDNPAWGDDSAAVRKKALLLKLYTDYLMRKEGSSEKTAFCKASFILSNFEPDTVIDHINRDSQNESATKSEELIRSSDFFIHEVKARSQTLEPRELFEPLHVGIVTRKYGRGTSIFQNTKGAFESYDAEYGYKRFIDDAAIIYKLEQLGLIKKEKKWERTGKYSYILTETDINKIKRIIFADNMAESEYYDSDFEPPDRSLPFRTMFDH